MFKHILFTGCVFLFSWKGYSQTGFEEILQQVEQNNTELLALTTGLEGKRFELLSGNNLPNPEAGFFYLPFGEHETGDYTEYQITQNFEFPTVYSSRKALIDQQVRQLELNYKLKRQEILLSAQSYALELVLLSKKMEVVQKRVSQAKTILDQMNQLFQSGELGILDLNKARVAWLQEQFLVQQLEIQQKNLVSKLVNLNGGKSIPEIPKEYPLLPQIGQAELLWEEKLQSEPQLIAIEQLAQLAQHQLQVEKNKVLPNLSAGFNRQGVMGSYYSGVYGGFSIPLWGSRGKVKAAQYQVDFQSQNRVVQTDLFRVQFDREYRDYQILQEKFQEYRDTLTSLDTEELLLQAYQLGELSFIQYYQEVQFFRQAFDTYLDMQHQLYQSHTSILKHQL